MITYSIIIPHKNTPELLQYCLNSIPIRNDVQVIVVDDNSTNDKVDFEHFPHWNGGCFDLILTKEGKGAGYARNVGLKHAYGKWVLFLDADDYFLPSIDAILDYEIETDADIIFYRPQAVMLNDKGSLSRRADMYNSIIDRYLASGDETELRCRYFSPVSKFVNRKIIESNCIRFDEIPYSNDNLFSVKIGVNANRILVREKSFYCITESEDTLTSNFMKKPRELQIRTDAFFRTQEIVHENGYSIDLDLVMRYLRKLFFEDKDSFVINFNRIRKMGYNKLWLLRELFKGNSRKAAVKRIIYSFFCTGF